jgi:micrococcal nuclease
MSARSATAWIALFAVLAVAALNLIEGPADSSLPPEDGTTTDAAGSTRDGLEGESARPSGRLSARVARVVDGDTIVIRIARDDETVRYIGVDTPESVKPNTPVECFAKQAARFNRDLVDGRTVVLTFDRERRDRYGRLLAYVDVGGRSVNAALISGGYARTLAIEPNTSRAGRLSLLEDRAQAQGRGLWSACR